MDDNLTFDPIERRAEKPAQRDADAETLAQGEITRDELTRAIGVFLPPTIVNRRMVRIDGHRPK